MNADWLLISCIASLLVAMGLAFILGACWLAGEADDATENERLLDGDCPWPLRHDELACRPDWVAKFKTAHSFPVTEGTQDSHA